MGKSRSANKPIEDLQLLQEIGSTAKMMLNLFRASEKVPNAVTDQQIAPLVIFESEAAHLKSEVKKPSDAILHKSGQIQECLGILEAENRQDAYAIFQSISQNFQPLRNDVKDRVNQRQQLANLVIEYLQVEKNSILGDIIKAIVEGKLGTPAAIKEVLETSSRKQQDYAAQVSKLQVNEDALDRRLAVLLASTASTTKALTGQGPAVTPEDTVRPAGRTS